MAKDYNKILVILMLIVLTAVCVGEKAEACQSHNVYGWMWRKRGQRKGGQERF